MGTKTQMASVSQQPQPPSAAVTERNGDAEMLLAPKTDIQELLQKQGEAMGVFNPLSASRQEDSSELEPHRGTPPLFSSTSVFLPARRSVGQHEL